MLEARSLTRSYGALPALRDASFVARPGQILGYLGPNGSGKSTTVRMLVGLMPPIVRRRGVAGAIDFRGSAGFPPSARLRAGGAAPLYPPDRARLSAAGRRPARSRRTRAGKRESTGLLDLLGLADDRYSTLSAFSKGMRQKVLHRRGASAQSGG